MNNKKFLPQMVNAILIVLFLVGCSDSDGSSDNSTTPTDTPPATTNGSIWIPAVNTSWQWQLTSPVDQSVDAVMYDIDLFDNETSVVASLHSQGRRVVCYISVGSWENWRPDANQFPASVIGNDYEGWSGEKWLDIRQIDLLAPIMRARLDQCKAKGFDAIEPDNIDGYTNDTGFPLTYQDQLIEKHETARVWWRQYAGNLYLSCRCRISGTGALRMESLPSGFGAGSD